jgi:hypothetical protein
MGRTWDKEMGEKKRGQREKKRGKRKGKEKGTA